MTNSRPADLDIGELYRKYQAMVARRVRQFVPASDVEEVTQDVFVRALEHRHQFRDQSAPVTWLYRMTTNHCLNWVRDRRTRRRLVEQFGPTAWAESRSENPEVKTFVHDLWRTLDPELASIGIYFYLDGLTQADIAKTLGCSERTIAYRLKDLQRVVREHAERT